MSWRVCRTLDVLLGEVNARWGMRDVSSDGSIGDPAHAARKSDHNPNALGVVRARDFDEDLDGDRRDTGADAAALAEHVRLLGKAGDPRLVPDGYVIYEGRIAGGSKGWEWREYTGPNDHLGHVHVSSSSTPGPGGYDSVEPWGIFPVPGPPAPPTPEDDMFTEDDRKKLNALYEDYAVKGKGVRQVILETAQRTKDLVTGKRPG